MYGLLLVIQNLDFSPNKDYGWLKLVILVLMILPFIFNLNVAMIISFLILGAEIIWGTFGKNIIRQLLFDTYLTISKDKEIEIKQKFTSLLTQSSQISFSTKTLKNDFFKLLNNHEKRWLNREIEHFFDG
jgi:hypothetical protein